MSNQFNKSNPEPPSGIKNSQQSLSKDFMIVTADKRASLAAKEILLNGGNALDAAIAAQNVLSVVYSSQLTNKKEFYKEFVTFLNRKIIPVRQ